MGGPRDRIVSDHRRSQIIGSTAALSTSDKWRDVNVAHTIVVILA